MADKLPTSTGERQISEPSTVWILIMVYEIIPIYLGSFSSPTIKQLAALFSLLSWWFFTARLKNINSSN